MVGRRSSAWWAFVCAFALTRAVTRQAPEWGSRFDAAVVDLPASPAPFEPRTAAPRELRRLPGIGESRAIAIARLRWQRGGEPLFLGDVPGIGESTVAEVRAWLEARGWSPSAREPVATDRRP